MPEDRLCPFCDEKPERCDLIEETPPPRCHLICERCGEWWMHGHVYRELRQTSGKYHGWRKVILEGLPKGVGTEDEPIQRYHLDKIIGYADTQ